MKNNKIILFLFLFINIEVKTENTQKITIQKNIKRFNCKIDNSMRENNSDNYKLINHEYEVFLSKDFNNIIRTIEEKFLIDKKGNFKNLSDLKDFFILIEKLINLEKFLSSESLKYYKEFIPFFIRKLKINTSLLESIFDWINFIGIESKKNISLLFYGNLNLKKLNDDKLKTFLWILYLHCFEKNKLILSKNNEYQNKKIYALPLEKAYLNNTNKLIRSDIVKNRISHLSLISYDDYSNQFDRELLSSFTNKEMGIDIINRRTNFLELLQCEDNEKITNKIYLQFEKISKILKKIKSIKIFQIENDLSKYIPSFLGDKNSGSFVYGLESSFKYWISDAISFTKNSSNKFNNTIFEDNFINKQYGYLNPLRYLQYAFDPLFNILPKKSIRDFEKINSDDFNIEIYKMILNQHGKTFGDSWKYYGLEYKDSFSFNNPLNLTRIFAPILNSTSKFIIYSYLKYESLSVKWNNTKSIYNTYLYLNNIAELIKESEILKNIIEDLYKKNDLDLNDFFPELLEIKEILSEKNKKLNEFLKEIKKINNSIIKYPWFIKNFFIPGLLSKFYFQKVKNNENIKTVKSFISAVDLALIKLKLLKNGYSIPKILNCENAYLNLKGVWSPMIEYLPRITNENYERIKNNLFLDSSSKCKNAIIVSPIGGGKTTTLSTIMLSIYLSNLGIVPADEAEMSYFSLIIDHMNPTYKQGEGSGHISERILMKQIPHLLENNEDNSFYIAIADELYSKTGPTYAKIESDKDLPPVLTHPNILFIMTTHNFDYIKYTKNIDYKTCLYYSVVNELKGVEGDTFFHRTYKIKEHDADNWWITFDKDTLEKHSRYIDYIDEIYGIKSTGVF